MQEHETSLEVELEVEELRTMERETIEKLKNVKLVELRKLRTLGEGHFGQVDLVCIESDDSGQTFALKRIRKSSGADSQAGMFTKSEKALLTECDSSFIAKLYKTFSNRRWHFILLESCPGGTLKQMLNRKKRFFDATARFYIAAAVEAIGYLHQKQIVFRDLKPENLVLDVGGYPKLIDFGLARKLQPGEKTNEKVGTPDYMAPEIISTEYYDWSVDCWALGVMLYQFLSGTYLFKGYPNRQILYGNIVKGVDDEVRFPECISDVAIELIKELCRKDPSERLGLQNGDIRGHRWYDAFNWEAFKQKSLPPPFKVTVQKHRRHGGDP